jgi:hypothetical protein
MDRNQEFIAKILGAEGAKQFDKKLKMFSRTDADENFRRKAYADTIATTMEINDMVMGKNGKRSTYAGASVSASNLAGVSIYAGIMRSFVESIAPIFAVQRNIDAPAQKIMYVDFYDILNDNLIVPNIGADQAWTDKARQTTETLDLSTSTTFTITGGWPITPHTFKAVVYDAAGAEAGTIYEDGNSRFIATPGILANTGSEVSYHDGTVKLVFAANTFKKITYACVWDNTEKDEVNKAYGKTKYYDVETSPLLVPVERNVVSDHAMQKQGIINSDELYANFVENEYTKAVNQRIFDAILQGYQGDTYQIDLSSFSLAAGLYETIVRSFKALLTQLENELARQTYKGAKCTGYLASPEAVNVFDLMNAGEGWVKNLGSTYYKDIVGWYNDVPVVRCVDLGEGEIMLTHRTDDGYLAPVFHAMFLAPTELPVVANYQNMTKYASGLYSMEGCGFSSSKLCIKAKVILPNDLKLVKLG